MAKSLTMNERVIMIYAPSPVTFYRQQRFGRGYLIFYEAMEMDRVAYFNQNQQMCWDQMAD